MSKRPREDWKMPEPPAPACVPWYYIIGGDDGVDLYWATEEQNEAGERWPDDDVALIDWPFEDDDIASWKDLVACGFHNADC